MSVQMAVTEINAPQPRAANKLLFNFCVVLPISLALIIKRQRLLRHFPFLFSAFDQRQPTLYFTSSGPSYLISIGEEPADQSSSDHNMRRSKRWTTQVVHLSVDCHFLHQYTIQTVPVPAESFNEPSKQLKAKHEECNRRSLAEPLLH